MQFKMLDEEVFLVLLSSGILGLLLSMVMIGVVVSLDKAIKEKIKIVKEAEEDLRLLISIRRVFRRNTFNLRSPRNDLSLEALVPFLNETSESLLWYNPGWIRVDENRHNSRHARAERAKKPPSYAEAMKMEEERKRKYFETLPTYEESLAALESSCGPTLPPSYEESTTCSESSVRPQ